MIFAPDRNLAAYVAARTGTEVIPVPALGCCPTHQSLSVRDVQEQMAAHPGAEVMVHPETTPPVQALADFIGSTSAMIRRVQETDAATVIVGTEVSILYRMRKLAPDKVLVPASALMSCADMRMITLDLVEEAVRTRAPVVRVDPAVAVGPAGPLSGCSRSAEMERYLVRYGEIFLKSDPVRRRWEEVLLRAGDPRADAGGVAVRTGRGRLWLDGPVDREALSRVFGVVSFSPTAPCLLEDLDRAVLEYMTAHFEDPDKGTFAVRVKRVGTHPFSSQERAASLGSLIGAAHPGLRVDLSNPEITLHVEIRDERCYLYHEVFLGPGGLPPGTQGTLVALVSGGIDSPVAAYMMMKRGCRILPLMVALDGYLDETAVARAEAVVERLRPYQPDIALHVLHDGYLRRAKGVLIRAGQERYTCVLCKRRMYRLAGRVRGQARSAWHRDWRGPGAGREPDPRQSPDPRRRGPASRLPAPERLRQGGDHRDRAPDRDVRDLDHAGHGVPGRPVDADHEGEAGARAGVRGSGRRGPGSVDLSGQSMPSPPLSIAANVTGAEEYILLARQDGSGVSRS